MRGAVRLAAVMGAPAIYVWTHDSIGLGEDGPTHQPVEHLAALRAIPGLSIVRPGGRQRDGVRVAGRPGAAERMVLRAGRIVPDPAGRSHPGGHRRRGRRTRRLRPRRRRRATRRHPDGQRFRGPDRRRSQGYAAGHGIGTRVVSVPCLDWFEDQDPQYIESVLPSAVTARVSIEAAIAQPWWRWLGAHGRPVSLEHYGASADFETLFREFGITAEPSRAKNRSPRPAAGDQHRAEPAHCTTSAATPARRPNPARRTTTHHRGGRSSVPTGPARTEPARIEVIMTTPQSTTIRSPIWPTPGFPCGWMICPGSDCSPGA